MKRFIFYSILLITILLIGTKVSAQSFSYESGGDTDEAFGTNAGGKKAWQTFTATSSADVVIVAPYIKRTSVDKPVYASIYATDVNGKPTGSSLGQCDEDEEIPTNYQFVEMHCDNDITLTASTKYAFVMECPTCDNSNYILWNTDESSPTFPDGNWGDWNGATINSYSTIDGLFKVYLHTDLTSNPSASSTATSTSSYSTTTYRIINTTQDIFNGYILFFIVFFGILFYFKK